MKALRLKALVPLLALLCFCSCDDDNPFGGGGIVQNQFPNAVGMLWKYQVYDSLTATTDTVWVSVTDSAMTRCGYVSYNWRTYWLRRDSVVERFAMVWVDTAMVEIISDSVSEPALLERFVFPLKEGATWTGPSKRDTCTVTVIGTVSVPAGTFRNSALVEHAWHLGLEGGGDGTETWLAPNVGIVYRHEYETYSDGATITVFTNRIWKLLDYNLGTCSLEEFPNTVGTEWEYELSVESPDSSYVDTVAVRIVERINMSYRDSATVWEVKGDRYFDTLFVSVLERRVFEVFDTLAVMPYENWYYAFPLAVGRYWGFDYSFAPMPLIDDKAEVTTPAGRFPTAFHYLAQGAAFNSYWLVEEWVAPNVGVVKCIFQEADLEPVITQEWTLLNYRAP